MPKPGEHAGGRLDCAIKAEPRREGSHLADPDRRRLAKFSASISFTFATTSSSR